MSGSNSEQNNAKYIICIVLQVAGILVTVLCVGYLIAELIMFNSSLFAGSMWHFRITRVHTIIAICVAVVAVIVTITCHKTTNQRKR
jgi:formate hydrogenlyase subunit 3/multisubunit Na+/H+ antiporter MnhD subunit